MLSASLNRYKRRRHGTWAPSGIGSRLRRMVMSPLLNLGPQFYVPLWVVLSCQAAMALGTLLGGWRIVKTMGSRITRLTPMQGFCAETGGALTLFGATSLGIPVSTTHTITGAIVGVGAARRVSAVRWNVATNVVTAWILTLPSAGLTAAAFYVCAGFLGDGSRMGH